MTKSDAPKPPVAAAPSNPDKSPEELRQAFEALSMSKPFVAAAPKLMPGTSPEELRRAFEDFEDAIPLWGPADDPEAYFQQVSKDLNCGAVFAAALPPPGAEAQIQSMDIGKLKVFYHPTWLVRPHEAQYFTWNYYIGRAGQGTESIIVDWPEQGIVVEVEGFSGGWEECRTLATGARTRIRLSYRDACGDRCTHEVVFPPDPKERMPVHLL